MTMLRRAMLVAVMLAMPMALLAGCQDWPHNETRQPASDPAIREGQQKADWHVSDAGAAPAQQPAEQPSANR